MAEFDPTTPKDGAEAAYARALLDDDLGREQRRARLMAATAHDSEIQMLISSVMNWQPRGFFGGDTSLNTGAGALSFGPGLLGLLSDARENRSG